MVANFVNLADNKFTLNGIEYHKNYAPIQVNQSDSQVRVISAYDSRFALVPPTHYSEYTVNGITYTSVQSLIHALVDVVFSKFTLDGVAKEFQDSILQYMDDIESDISGFKGDVNTTVNNFQSAVNNDLQQFESEAQDIKDALANMTTTGKIYDSLDDAIAESPKPEDGTPFSVMGDGDNDGYWSFDSAQPDGVKFGRKFDRRIQVESISELRNYEGRSGEAVDVLGYYENGDGGGGTFYWDAASTEDDDGGTVIQATGIPNGRWKRKIEGSISVLYFGAKGDGVSNDTEPYLQTLRYVDSKNGGTILFPAGLTFRISKGYLIDSNERFYIPDNTHITAYGAVVKATDTDDGTTIGLIRCNNSSISGGTFDGNWDGGTGEGRWEGATGVVSDDGQPGNQSVIDVTSSLDCLIKDVFVKNSVNDGIAGYRNENITLENCQVNDTGEHAFYFSFSQYIYSNNCKAFNIGRNNWDRESVMFKMRDGTHYYLNNFYGFNEGPQAKAKISEGSGSHFYVKNSTFINVSAGIYATDTPTEFTTENNNYHFENSLITSIDGGDLFMTGVSKECSIVNCEIRNFSRVGLMPFSKNNRIIDAESVTTNTTEKNDIKDLTVSLVAGIIYMYGLEGSVFEGINIIPGSNGYLPAFNRLYASNSVYKNIQLLAPEGTFTTHAGFLIYADGIVIDGMRTLNVPVCIRNDQIDNANIVVMNLDAKNGNSVIRDEQLGGTWRVSNLTVDNFVRVFYGSNGNNSLFQYSNLRTTNTNALSNVPEYTQLIREEGTGGASGTYISQDGKTVTVENGVITSITEP